MKDILQDIIAHKKNEISDKKRIIPYSLLEKEASEAKHPKTSLANALKKSETGIIAEYKRRSPSKGWINEIGSSSVIPISYQNAGATAISILVDSQFFGGSPQFIKDARDSGVVIPILYKEFIIDEYQILQAKAVGASAVLLIAACLDEKTCERLIKFAHELELETLLEIHSVYEVQYSSLPTDCIGVNNRNLGSFITDVKNSFALASLLPQNAVKVSESGISDPNTIKDLRKSGFSGFLIGETFMKTVNPGQTLKNLISKI